MRLTGTGEAGPVEIMATGPLLDRRATLDIRYTVHPAGAIDIRYRYRSHADLPVLPRVGMLWALPADLNNMGWYGPGPGPTYADRDFERVGIYETSLLDDWVDYSRPQENGNRSGIRWMELTDGGGAGLRIEALGGAPAHDGLLLATTAPRGNLAEHRFRANGRRRR